MTRILERSAKVLFASLGLALAGCATTDIKSTAMTEAQAMKTGPAAPPFRTITGFSDSLRCMDNLMIVYGVRDWPVLVEDLADSTKKINAGTRDMLITAMSDLSKRSRAIRLLTFGADVSNLANFHANAESKAPYRSLPVYDVRGSISQLDEGLYKKQIEGGITFGPVGVGAAKSGDVSVLALDLSVISAQDYSLVPGVTARNSVFIYKEGAGIDGEAEYKKLGVNFGMTVTRAEGKAQAVRALVELAVVELAGKLTHTPYWTCLGADPAGDEVKNEISDWFYTMSIHGEIVTWAQQQLAVRGLYEGEIDGKTNPEFDRAMAKMRARLGLSAEPVLDEVFFATYLRTNHRNAAAVAAVRPRLPAEAQAQVTANHAKTAAAATAPAAPPATPAAAEEPLKLSLTAGGEMKAGQVLSFTVTPNRDAHVYCYLQDPKSGVQRFYPNRFATASLVKSSAPLVLPGAMRFQIVVPAAGETETLGCFATPRDVQAEIATAAFGRDFEALPVKSLREVREAFINVIGGKFAQQTLAVQAR